ncbi:outer membrane beta-barrel protein [Spirosoma aureum]|uniref:outer membrane beta-barrel protein n=1 Tax=Spirosoma aureum TaxID=2692134 RepID=UPI001E4C98BD|nr:outer membrane beta-barrel protein [Spirosoma aureum]
MKSIKISALLALLVIAWPAHLYAQRSTYWQERPGAWLLNAGLGTTRYLGDMNERGDLAHLRLGVAMGIAAAYRFSDRFTFRAEAQLYYIHGSQQDTHLSYNNLSFRSLNPEIWAGVQMDLWHPDDRNHIIIPYVMAGVGFTCITPKTTYKGQTYSLAPLHTEGVDYNRLPVILRYGIGVPIVAGERFKWHLEGVYTHVLSDYVDDVSTVYPDRSRMEPLAAALSDRRLELGKTPNLAGAKRGNNTRRDGYFILSARLIWVVSTAKQQHYRRSRRG